MVAAVVALEVSAEVVVAEVLEALAVEDLVEVEPVADGSIFNSVLADRTQGTIAF